jgi:DNA modification methylase
VTSPPYYGLRDYGVDGQIGLEETPKQYIERLVSVFNEFKRVLKPEGTLWVNIGDSYVGTGGDRKKPVTNELFQLQQANNPKTGRYSKIQSMKDDGLKPKDLIGIPWTLAFALRDNGWYLRIDNVWNKPNPMPESVTDRCTRSHEYVFMFSKSQHYYYDWEAIQEPCVQGDNIKRDRETTKLNNTPGRSHMQGLTRNDYQMRNKRSVWTVPTSRYEGAHFATFPEELITPCILAGCPKGGTVLDMFFGSGTTGVVALKNFRNFVGIELNPVYVEMANKRIEPYLAQSSIFDFI